MMRSKTHRARALALSVALLSVLCLACLGEVDGERATTGECPAGEICSEATPDGLTFVGRMFFDEPMLRLGPVLVGGTLDIGLRTREGAPLPDYVATSTGPALTVREGESTFGPTNEDGEPLYPVEGYVTVRANRPGVSHVRISDATSGELFDRLEIEAVELDSVAVVVAQEPEREALYAGCEEMIGVRLLADQSDVPVRGFDEGMTVSANGHPLVEEPLFWDCVVYDVGADESEVEVEVQVAGRTFRSTLPVVSLEAGASCPERAD